mmetsp:Transcript_29058/g.59439  ORF Transcript_29058/g.59439 Transcript_29058/m.59439 type:complete len:226 (+) Transcript_29058:1027-1704(+)
MSLREFSRNNKNKRLKQEAVVVVMVLVVVVVLKGRGGREGATASAVAAAAGRCWKQFFFLRRTASSWKRFCRLGARFSATRTSRALRASTCSGSTSWWTRILGSNSSRLTLPLRSPTASWTVSSLGSLGWCNFNSTATSNLHLRWYPSMKAMRRETMAAVKVVEAMVTVRPPAAQKMTMVTEGGSCSSPVGLRRLPAYLFRTRSKRDGRDPSAPAEEKPLVAAGS